MISSSVQRIHLLQIVPNCGATQSLTIHSSNRRVQFPNQLLSLAASSLKMATTKTSNSTHPNTFIIKNAAISQERLVAETPTPTRKNPPNLAKNIDLGGAKNTSGNVEWNALNLQSLEFCTGLESFEAATTAGNLVPVWQTIDLDVTSHEVFRCMASRTHRPSEIFMDVVEPDHHHNTGTFTIINAPPSVEILAKRVFLTVLQHSTGVEGRAGSRRTDSISKDLIAAVLRAASEWQPAMHREALEGTSPQQTRIPSGAFCGGWVDLVTRKGRDKVNGWYALRAGKGAKMNEHPVQHMGLVDEVVVIDHDAGKVHMVHWVRVDEFATPAVAYRDVVRHLQHLSARLVRAAARRLSRVQGRGPPSMARRSQN